MEKQYMHITGQIDTKEGWIDSYTEEELTQREITATEAFLEDVDKTLFEKEDL